MKTDTERNHDEWDYIKKIQNAENQPFTPLGPRTIADKSTAVNRPTAHGRRMAAHKTQTYAPWHNW